MQSAHVHRVVGRALIRVARAVCGVGVVLQAIADVDKIDEVEAVVDTLLGDFAKRLQEEMAQLDAVKGSSSIEKDYGPSTPVARSRDAPARHLP